MQKAWGTHPSVAWGGSPSPLYKNVVGPAKHVGATCFNINYTDNGLFGIVISGPASNIGAVRNFFSLHMHNYSIF